MRYVLSALAGASLVVATGALAQTAPAQTQAQTSPNTKVYAYQKAVPKPAGPSATAAPEQKPSEQLPGSVPFGSAKWWEIMARSAGGEGAQ